MDASLKAAKDSMFSLLYMITEGAEQRPTTRVWGLLSLTVEMLQVVRVITHVTYGWTHESQAMARWFDLVAVVVDQVRQWVPDLYFYILACVLVVVACADSVFIIKRTRDGVLAAVWPLKVLRFLVATIVTTLLSTTLEFLLYPLDCTTDGMTASEWLHGGGAGCSPFGIPDVFLSVFTILIVLVFVVFAMGVNLFAFEINPIARGSRAVCTGRVEVAWTAFKIAAGLLPFLSPVITPIAVSIVLSLFAARAVWDHTLRLPFQSKSCNIFRGGVHAAALWLCLASVGVSAVGGSYTEKQGMQWALLGLVPIAFLAGAAGVLLRMRIVRRFINILRAEYDRSLADAEASSDSEGMSAWPRKGAVHTPKVQRSLAQDTNLTSASAISTIETHRMRTGYDKFFDTAWKDRRAFRTSADALLACRHLLGLREEHDLPFLNFVVEKGLTEHPESLDLLFFQLVALHFIYGDTKQAHEQEKKMADKKDVFIDRAFHLYAVMRRATHDLASSNMGQELNLAEFDAKMNVARRSHQNCLSLMKKFFHLVVKQEKSGSTAYGRPSPAVIDDMVAAVHQYEGAVETAKLEYRWLMDKFPLSTAVILSYAHFTDTVLNDIKAAKALRLKALAVENAGMMDQEEELDKMDNASSVSSDNDSRDNTARFTQSWRNDIVGSEFATLSSLQMRVQITLVLILIISTAGFVLMDSILFSEQANENIRLIDVSGLFRALTVNAAFWLRSAMMDAHSGDSAAYKIVAGKNDGAMAKLHKDHVSNFNVMTPGAVENFYNTKRSISHPAVHGWKFNGQPYWNFGVDLSRRGRLAASTPMAELADPNYKLDEISTEKRSVIYVQENSFRQAIPYFFDVVLLYDANVAIFGDTARTVVAVNAVVNALLVILLSYMTVTTIRVLTTVQYQVVACRLALALPRVTAKKLYKFYHSEHHQLAVIGDEEAEKEDIIAGEGKEGASVAEERAPTAGSAEGPGNPSAQSERREEASNGDQSTSNLRLANGDQSQPEMWEQSPFQRYGVTQGSNEAPLLEASTSKLKSALKSRDAPSDPPTPTYSSTLQLTPEALLSLQQQLEGDNGPEDSNMQHYLTEEYASHRTEEIVAAMMSTGSPLQIRELRKEEVDTTMKRRGGGGRSASPEKRGREAEVGGARLRSSMGFADKGSKGKGHKEDRGEGDKSDADGSPLATKQSSSQSGADSKVTVSGGRFGAGSVLRPTGAGTLADVAQDEDPSMHDSSAHGSQKMKRRVSMEASVEEPQGSPMQRSREGVGAKELTESAPDELREFDPEVEADIIQSVTALHAVHNRVSTYVVVLILILVMCVCSIVVPSRFIGQMVNLGPTSNHAAYRRCLVKSCAHLTRELVLNDGFSRMTQGEIAGTLNGILSRLRQSDKAVRRGNLLRVGQGADFWSPEHNTVMYDPGCPWKKDGNCSTPDYPTAGTGGVYALSLQYMQSVETVLETYGGPEEEWIDTFGVPRDEEGLKTTDFDSVSFDPARSQLVKSDKAVRFVMQGFSGDLFNGYGLVLDVLKNEMNNILTSVHFELRLMYGIYVALQLLGFYFLLFRRTISSSYAYTEGSREFVQMLPSHILSRGELELFRGHFCETKDDF